MNEFTAKWLDEHQQELVATLQDCLRLRSVRNDDDTAPGAPYGRDIAKCLEFYLNKAQELGFATKNVDGYVGCVDYGEGEELLAIVNHLDVVPEGNGWTHPPYGAVIEDGKLYGRGAQDNKGQAMALLFALAAVKASGLETKRRIRLIGGCDEEHGMSDLEYYVEKEGNPDLAFSPDAGYPLINSEKMIYDSTFAKEYASSVKLLSGAAFNVVPADADCFLPLPVETVQAACDAADPTFGYTCEAAEGGTKLHVLGKAAHGSNPDNGKNACLAALQVMKTLPLPAADLETAKALADLLEHNSHAENFGLDISDASGRLTMNIGICVWDETGIHRLTQDVRAPISASEDEITAKLSAGFAKAGLTMVDHNCSPGYYISPEHELVSQLMDVYEEHFGERPAPVAMGGGTYARKLKNAVAFGTARHGLSGPVHAPEEFVRLDFLLQDAKVMADAIIRLACK